MPSHSPACQPKLLRALLVLIGASTWLLLLEAMHAQSMPETRTTKDSTLADQKEVADLFDALCRAMIPTSPRTATRPAPSWPS